MFNAGSVFTRLSDRTNYTTQNYFERGGGNIQLKQSSKRGAATSWNPSPFGKLASKSVVAFCVRAAMLRFFEWTPQLTMYTKKWWCGGLSNELLSLSLSLTCGGRSENGKMCSEKNTHGSEHKYIPSIYVGFAWSLYIYGVALGVLRIDTAFTTYQVDALYSNNATLMKSAAHTNINATYTQE